MQQLISLSIRAAPFGLKISSVVIFFWAWHLEVELERTVINPMHIYQESTFPPLGRRLLHPGSLTFLGGEM